MGVYPSRDSLGSAPLTLKHHQIFRVDVTVSVEVGGGELELERAHVERARAFDSFYTDVDRAGLLTRKRS